MDDIFNSEKKKKVKTLTLAGLCIPKVLLEGLCLDGITLQMTPSWLRDDPGSSLHFCPFQTSGRRTVRAALSSWSTASMRLTLWRIIVRAHLSVQLKMSHCALPAPFPDILRGQFTFEKDTCLF